MPDIKQPVVTVEIERSRSNEIFNEVFKLPNEAKHDIKLQNEIEVNEILRPSTEYIFCALQQCAHNLWAFHKIRIPDSMASKWRSYEPGTTDS